jgi:hypothetical protein
LTPRLSKESTRPCYDCPFHFPWRASLNPQTNMHSKSNVILLSRIIWITYRSRELMIRERKCNQLCGYFIIDIINMVIDRVPIYQLQIWSMWHLETSTYPFSIICGGGTQKKNPKQEITSSPACTSYHADTHYQ